MPELVICTLFRLWITGAVPGSRPGWDSFLELALSQYFWALNLQYVRGRAIYIERQSFDF